MWLTPEMTRNKLHIFNIADENIEITAKYKIYLDKPGSACYNNGANEADGSRSHPSNFVSPGK